MSKIIVTVKKQLEGIDLIIDGEHFSLSLPQAQALAADVQTALGFPASTVLINVHGGIVDNVVATVPTRVLILDYDKNFNPLREEPEAALVIDKTPYTLRDWEPTGDENDRKEIADTLTTLDLPRCDVCKGPRVNEELEQFEGYITDEDHDTKHCYLCAGKDKD